MLKANLIIMKKLITLATIITALIPSFTLASFDQSLSFGMTNPKVEELQEFLSTQGCFNRTATGYFGFITLSAVKCFQAKNSVPATGYFGVLSRAAANKIADEILATSTAAELSETGTVAPIEAPKPQTIIIQQAPVQPQAAAVAPAPVVVTFTTGSPVCLNKADTLQTVPITITGAWKTAILSLHSDNGYAANYTISSDPTEWNRINPFRTGQYAFAYLDPASYTYGIKIDQQDPINGSFAITNCTPTE